jgi:transposase
MQTYSDDLRQRVAAAYATGPFTISQVASRFAVSTSFVEKLL